MLKNKLYESVKTYLDKYLFGFDKSQLEMSVLKGNINLNNVNVKPNKANKFLQSMMVPFALKAGTVGKLELKISLLQMWSSPVEVLIDDLFIILGPNYSIVSNDDSYIEEDEQHLNDSYDSSNMFNIFDHQLKLKKKGQDGLEKQKSLKRQNTQEQQAWEKQTFDFIKNLKLRVNRVHLRYEDDVFNGEFPFSFGLVIDKLVWESTDQKWRFESVNQTNPQFQKVNNDPLLLLKNCFIENLRIYWNCMSEMYIPTSLWEQTRHLKYQIFEAMEVSDLRGFLLQPFDKDRQQGYQYLMTSTSIQNQLMFFKSEDKLSENSQISLIMTPFELNITPRMVEDMNNLVELCQNYFLSKDLKQYRPHRRPITQAPAHIQNDPVFKRKRKLIARDWFFYVVWFVRLKRILKNMYSTELLQQELESNTKYSQILKILDNPQSQIKDLKKDFQNQEQDDQNNDVKMTRLHNLRLKSLKINLFNKNIFEATHPIFQIEASGIQLEQYRTTFDTKQNSNSGLIGDIHISALSQRNKRDLLQKQSIVASNKTKNQQETDNNLGTGFTISSFISSTFNKTPQKQIDNAAQNQKQPHTNLQSLKNLQNVQQQQNQLNNTSQFNLPSKQNTKALVSPSSKMQNDENKSLFGTVLSKVFGFAANISSTPNNSEKLRMSENPQQVTTQLLNDEYDLNSQAQPNDYQQNQMPHIKNIGFSQQALQINSSSNKNHLNQSQSAYYTNGTQNGGVNNINTLLSKQRSSKAISHTQNLASQRQIPLPGSSNHLQNQNNKALMNSSRIFGENQGLIQDQRLNSASRTIIDANELKADPVHQFLMSDLSIKDLRQNIEQINQANKAQRMGTNQINNSGQKQGNISGSTPQKSIVQNYSNYHYQNSQLYKGLRDFQGKSNSNIPLPLGKNNSQQDKQPIHSKKDIEEENPNLPQNYIILRDLSATEVIISQPIFTLQAFSKNPDSSIFFSQSKTLQNEEKATKNNNSQDKSTFKLELQLGSSTISYSNETLGQLFQFILEYQQLNVFRDIQIIQEFFHQSQRRQTSAQRRLELMMPFYIIKKLVQNHQTGHLKQLINQTEKSTKSQNIKSLNSVNNSYLNSWEQKLSYVDDSFRNFYFDIDFKFKQSSVAMWTDQNQQLCKFTTPASLQATAFKHSQDCGFEVLGFNFTGCNSLSVMSNFFQNLFSQVNMMKQHPAIQRGVDFYQKLHDEVKEKERQMKASREKAKEMNRIIEYKQKTSKASAQSNKQLSKSSQENKNFILIDQSHQDPSSLKFKGQNLILQDVSNTPDQQNLFNRYHQQNNNIRKDTSTGDQTVKASMATQFSNKVPPSQLAQQMEQSQNQKIQVMRKVPQGEENQDYPVYLQTEGMDDEDALDGGNSFLIDLDQDYPINQNTSKPQALLVASMTLNQNELDSNFNSLRSKPKHHKPTQGFSSDQVTSSNYTTQNANIQNHIKPSHQQQLQINDQSPNLNISSNYSSMNNILNRLNTKEPPHLQPSSFQHTAQLAPSHLVNNQNKQHQLEHAIKTINSSSTHNFKQSHQQQNSTSHQNYQRQQVQQQNYQNSLNSTPKMISTSSQSTQQIPNKQSQQMSTLHQQIQPLVAQSHSSRQLASTGSASQSSQSNGFGSGLYQNQNAKPFPGIVGKPMKSVASLPVKHLSNHSVQNNTMNMNQSLHKMGMGLGNQILPKQQR